jgi:Flp pilus assembly protein TadG
MLQALGRRLRRFARHDKGNVAILVGFALIPVMLGLGVAVDFGRALVVRERMADAADAAALAIGSWPDLTDAELTAKAQQFFDANYPGATFGTVGKLNVALSDDTVTVTVHGQVPTTIMRLANFSKLDVGATSVVTKKSRKIELILVLDITGSMNSGGKLGAMKNAAKKLVEDLFGDNATSEDIKIGIVPFSAAVNIGSDKKDSGWVDTATYPNNSTVAKEDFSFSDGQSAFTLFDNLRNRDWTGCVRERGGSYELTDEAPAGSADSKWAPYFAPDEPSSSEDDNCGGSSYLNNYLCDTDNYTSANCPTPPGPNTGTGKRQCYTGKYNAFASSSSKGPQYNCPPETSKIVPMTNSKSTIIAKINGLDANGSTVLPTGLLWGWRAISPTPPYTEAMPYSDKDWVKAIVFLTDGENDVNEGSNGINKSVYNAFGFAKNGHLGSTSGSNADSTLDNKTLTVCNAIKGTPANEGEGILLYTIGFQVSSHALNLLRNCASKPDMFYSSPTNAQLASIFQDIAQGLSELRIAQ